MICASLGKKFRMSGSGYWLPHTTARSPIASTSSGNVRSQGSQAANPCALNTRSGAWVLEASRQPPAASADEADVEPGEPLQHVVPHEGGDGYPPTLPYPIRRRVSSSRGECTEGFVPLHMLGTSRSTRGEQQLDFKEMGGRHCVIPLLLKTPQ